METIVIIGAVIQVITLIAFFVMTYNVMVIKKLLSKEEKNINYYIEAAAEEEAIGNIDKAKEFLNRAKYQCNKSEAYYINGLEPKQHFIERIDAQLAKL